MSEIDAVKALECMAIDMVGALAGLSEKEPLADVLCQRIEAINLAQSALREKQERDKGCVWCKEDDKIFLDGQHFHMFCSYCGKRLEVQHD